MKTKDVLPPYEFKRRDVKQALKAAANRIGENFLIGGQEHFYLEGQVAMAIPEEHGAMTIFSSDSASNRGAAFGRPHAGVARCDGYLRMPPHGRCLRRQGKPGTQWALLAALAARVTGRPVKCRLDRDDDMMMTGKRHDFRCQYEAGYDKTGRVTASMSSSCRAAGIRPI